VLLPIPFSDDVARVAACRAELRNCVRELLGDAFSRLVSDAAGSVFRLNGNEAGVVSGMVERAKSAGARKSDVSLAYDGPLTRMTTALSSSDTLRAADTALGAPMSHESAERVLRGLGVALAACRNISRAVESENVATTERELLCSFRAGRGLAAAPMHERWPGCACDRGRGRVLAGICVTSSVEGTFADSPVDVRLVRRLESSLRKLTERAAPLVPVSVELLGCTEVRLQMGANVRDLVHHPDRGLRSSDISDHASGTACDVGAITFRAPDCSERRLGVGSLRLALERHARRSGQPRWAEYRRAHRGSEREGALFRELAGRAGDDEDSWLLRLGGISRGAFSDTGLRTYSPLTNAAHDDHFHIELY
jgi:hypothetical protein